MWLYIILFLIAQLGILQLFRWIRSHIAGRNERMLGALLVRNVKDLMDLRNSMKSRRAWDNDENRWLAELINQAIHIKVQQEVERRHVAIQKQLAEKSASLPK